MSDESCEHHRERRILRCTYSRDGLGIIEDAQSEIPRSTDSRWHGYISNLAPSEFRARHERWLLELLCGGDYLAHYGEHVDPFTAIDEKQEYPVRAAVRYATEENLRVQMVSRLLQGARRNGSEDYLGFVGELFYQSHHPYRECGLGSDACDNIVELAREAGIAGAKMTGGGSGAVFAGDPCAFPAGLRVLLAPNLRETQESTVPKPPGGSSE